MASKRSILLRTMMIFDLIVMIAAIGIATWGVYNVSGAASNISFDSFLSIRIKVSNVLLIAVALLSWHVIFDALRLYQSRRLSTNLVIARDIAIATL